MEIRSFAAGIYSEAVRTAFRWTADGEVAADLAGEAISSLLTAEPRLVLQNWDESRLRRYFFVILKNTWRDWCAKQKNRGRELDETRQVDTSVANFAAEVVKIDLGPFLNRFSMGTKACLLLTGMGYSYKEIADRLNVQPAAVAARLYRARRRLADYGLTFQNAGLSLESVDLVVPPKAVGLLTVNQLAILSGRSHRTVKSRLRNIAQRYGLDAEVRRSDNGNEAEHWHPRVLSALIYEAVRYPPAGGWLTLHRLAILSGEHYQWVAARVEKLGIKGEERRHGDGRVLPHYPPDAVSLIKKEAAKRKEAGEKVTVRAIMGELGWTRYRTNQGLKRIRAVAEPRDDVHGVERPHYDRSVIEQLRKLPHYPPKKDWLNCRDIINRTGWRHLDVKQRLTEIPLAGEWRREENYGRDSVCYPPEVLSYFTKPCT